MKFFKVLTWPGGSKVSFKLVSYLNWLDFIQKINLKTKNLYFLLLIKNAENSKIIHQFIIDHCQRTLSALILILSND